MNQALLEDTSGRDWEASKKVSPTSPLSQNAVYQLHTVGKTLRNKSRRRAGGHSTRPAGRGVRAGANTMSVPMSVTSSGVADVVVDVGRSGHARCESAASGGQINGLFGKVNSSHGGDRERGARRCWR